MGDGTITYTPVIKSSGIDSFSYTITDDKGGFDTGTINITIKVNVEPIANAGEDQSVNTGTQVTINGTLSSDPNGD
ncbi:cadherin-like domain-containing protein, partial [Candidatus Desantisbacteria bacterium]|nr:cadherin-like domain-containing protein [Candidatus Desantisbacteria bacterium]